MFKIKLKKLKEELINFHTKLKSKIYNQIDQLEKMCHFKVIYYFTKLNNMEILFIMNIKNKCFMHFNKYSN